MGPWSHGAKGTRRQGVCGGGSGVRVRRVHEAMGAGWDHGAMGPWSMEAMEAKGRGRSEKADDKV